MKGFIATASRVLAGICAFLFVVTTVLALLLMTIERQLFDSRIYKNVMIQQQAYARLPGIIAESMASRSLFNPCAASPVTCENISDVLKGCFVQALGYDRYVTLSTGSDQPSQAENRQIQNCTDQYGLPNALSSQGSNGSQSGMPAFLQDLSAANWETLITMVLPANDLRNMTESALDQIFDYMNGKIDRVALPLTSIRQRLSGSAGTQVVTQLLRFQPACTPTELLQIGLGLLEGNVILCNPPDNPTMDAIIQTVALPLASLAVNIPDEVVLIQPPTEGTAKPGSGPFGTDPVTTLRVVRSVMGLTFLLPIALLLVIAVMAIRSFKAWLLWWGIPILAAGVAGLGIVLIALLSVNWGWLTFIAPHIPAYLPASFGDLGRDLLQGLASILLKSIGIQALVLSTLGLVACAAAFFISDRQPFR